MLLVLRNLVFYFLMFNSSIVQALDSYADVVAPVMSGVVNIRSTSYVRGRNAALDPYQFFLNGRLPKITSSQSLGSGVILNSHGQIITNYHVISNAAVVEVLFADQKKKVKARLVGVDTKTDLALLEVKLPKGVRPVDLGDSDRLRVGDVVLAIGNPFGYSHTVTSGIISALGRVIGLGPYDQFLQTDAAIHPGNSGGPLVDTRGRIIGINSAVAENAPGIGFAIPINLAKTVIADLSRYGKVIRPWLGIVGKNILSEDELSDEQDPVGVSGVIISDLVVEGPAQRSGLKIGDLLTQIESVKIIDLNQFQRLLNEKKPGQSVALKIYRRHSGRLNLKVHLGETPKASDLPSERDLF